MGKKSLYTDTRSALQLLGCLIKKPVLLNRPDKYKFDIEDFTDDFHKIIFTSINNLRAQGLKNIEPIDIDNYLSNRPTLYKIFNNNKGVEFLAEIIDVTDLNNVDYYYNRVKKMTLLRMYNNYGVDVKWLYNPSCLELELLQKQEDWLDNTDIGDIAQAIDNRIDKIKSQYLNSIADNLGAQAGQNIFELIERYKEVPEVGIPLFGPLVNTIVRGARLKKFYLRSSTAGTGKTRMGIADICTFSCGKIYDLNQNKWIKYGAKEPSLFITTEQEIDEVQTMMLAFLSGVQEDHILNGRYEIGEEERVIEAAKIIKDSPIWIEELHDFSLDDIENTIRRYVIDYKVKYVVHDYIHTSLKILEEITRKTGGVKLREDNVLFMLSIRLKDLCNELGIFILSSTQLNGDWMNAKEANQNLLRGM